MIEYDRRTAVEHVAGGIQQPAQRLTPGPEFGPRRAIQSGRWTSASGTDFGPDCFDLRRCNDGVGGRVLPVEARTQAGRFVLCCWYVLDVVLDPTLLLGTLYRELFFGEDPFSLRANPREAGRQSHGSGPEPDSRVTKEGCSHPRKHVAPEWRRHHVFEIASRCRSSRSPSRRRSPLGGSPVRSGVLDARGTAPTTNTDGTSLTDLASYRVYYGTRAPPVMEPPFFRSPPRRQVLRRTKPSPSGSRACYGDSLLRFGHRGRDGARESACTTSANAVARLDLP